MESEHFKDAELKCPHCGVNGCHKELLDALESLRAFLKLPIVINSAYRCPEHNAAVGGAPRSEHMLGMAADIHVDGVTTDALERAARNISAIKGIGRNDFAGFVHVDVRPAAASWCYNEAGKQIPYYFPIGAKA